MQSKKGFTLIELLVVIAIIAILAAILFPVFLKAKESSRKAACVDNMHQAGLAFQLYAGDYYGRLPLVKYKWHRQVVRYIGGGGPNRDFGVNFMRCPSQPKYKTLKGTYSVNYGPNRGGVFGYTLSRHVDVVPAKVFIMADAIDNSSSVLAIIYTPAVWYYTEDRDGDGIRDTYNMYGVTTMQIYNGANPMAHENGANYLFVGGHVKWVSKLDWLLNKNNIWGDQSYYK